MKCIIVFGVLKKKKKNSLCSELLGWSVAEV